MPEARPWEARLRELHAQGLDDVAIAQKGGWPYSTTNFRRREVLKLPANPFDRSRLRAARKAQAVARGCTNWGKMMRQRQRLRYCWVYPGCTGPAEAKVCLYLKENPAWMTPRQIMQAVGGGDGPRYIDEMRRRLRNLARAGILSRLKNPDDPRGQQYLYQIYGRDGFREAGPRHAVNRKRKEAS
jgi:hypothetical protein